MQMYSVGHAARRTEETHHWLQVKSVTEKACLQYPGVNLKIILKCILNNEDGRTCASDFIWLRI